MGGTITPTTLLALEYVFSIASAIGIVLSILSVYHARRHVRDVYENPAMRNGRPIVASMVFRRAAFSLLAYILFIAVGAITVYAGAPEVTVNSVVVRIVLTGVVLILIGNDIKDIFDRNEALRRQRARRR